MIEVSIDYIKPGDILAKNHTFKRFEGGMSSAVDLMKGFKLTESIIQKLKQDYNVYTLKIEDPTDSLNDLEILDEYNDGDRQKAIQVLVENMNEVKTSGIINMKALEEVTDNIIENVFNLMKNGKGNISYLSKFFSEVQNHDTYTWAHSVNVAIYSTVIAHSMPDVFNYRKIQTLVFNMLLHDMGKVRVPLEILNKQGKLTPAEFLIIQKHPMEGYIYLKKMNDKLEKLKMLPIPSTLRVACLHHHQNYDGTGYPSIKISSQEFRSLHGVEIPLIARISAVSDAYDALSSKRPYRQPLHPLEVLKILHSESGSKLDPKLVQIIEKNIHPFPKGSTVNLSTNELGIVIGHVNNNKFKPIVKPYMKKIWREGKEDIIKLFNRENIEITPGSKVQIVINEKVYQLSDNKSKIPTNKTLPSKEPNILPVYSELITEET